MNIEELSIRLRIITINRQLYEKMELKRQKLETCGAMAAVILAMCQGDESAMKAGLAYTYASLIAGNYIDGYLEKNINILEIYNNQIKRVQDPLIKASIDSCREDTLIRNFIKATSLILDDGYSEEALGTAIKAIIECAMHYYIDLEKAIEKVYHFIQRDTEEIALRKIVNKEGGIFGD
ncbi:hypothetical protein [Fenollaria massiliensis]|uniref:hypothetical protein n=1 Tax=Fenollaria massiliensis TaxID=938288 RepID=UPI00037F8F06|nr:hypothetical protein [Fenollaria massiliensis]